MVGDVIGKLIPWTIIGLILGAAFCYGTRNGLSLRIGPLMRSSTGISVGLFKVEMMLNEFWNALWRREPLWKNWNRISVTELEHFEVLLENGNSGLDAGIHVRLKKQPGHEIVQLLLLCAYHGLRKTFCEIMSEHGSAIENNVKDFNNAFLIACRNGQVDIAEYLLSQKKIDVNCTTSHGHSALILASTNRHLEVVKLLVGNESANLNHANRFNCTALSSACQTGDYSIVDTLLMGKSIDPTVNNHLAIKVAMSLENEKIVRLMLERSRLCLLPCSIQSSWFDKMIQDLQAVACETARLCTGISESPFLYQLPKHLRAYILALAFGNSLWVVRKQRCDEVKPLRVLMKIGPEQE